MTKQPIVNRRTRLATASLAVALALPATAAIAGPVGPFGPERVRVWEVSRTKAASRRIDASVRAVAHDSRGTVMLVGRGKTDTAQKIADQVFIGELGGEAYPAVYTADGSVNWPECQAGCEDPNPNGVTMNRTFAEALLPLDLDVYYVVTRQLETTVTIRSPGWRVREIKGGFRVIKREDARATGAETYAVDIEHFEYAEAPGGKYGSVAYASIPGVTPRCTGSATMTGGVPSSGSNGGRMNCYGPAVVAASFRATLWRNTGDATGVTGFSNRIAVFDLPRLP